MIPGRQPAALTKIKMAAQRARSYLMALFVLGVTLFVMPTQSGTVGAEPRRLAVVSITPEGTFAWGGETLSHERLAELLSGEFGRPIDIQVHAQAPFQAVAFFLEQAQQFEKYDVVIHPLPALSAFEPHPGWRGVLSVHPPWDGS